MCARLFCSEFSFSHCTADGKITLFNLSVPIRIAVHNGEHLNDVQQERYVWHVIKLLKHLLKVPSESGDSKLFVWRKVDACSVLRLNRVEIKHLCLCCRIHMYIPLLLTSDHPMWPKCDGGL